MDKVIVPVDGSASSVHAVEHVRDLYQKRPFDIILLNVQMPVHLAHGRVMVTEEELTNYYHDQGQEKLEEAMNVLRAEQIPYKKMIEVGNVADTISKVAEKEGADHIVMGTRGLGALQNVVVGSVSMKLLHTTSLPVTLIH